MNITVRTRITHNRIPELIAKFPAAVSDVVKKTAFDILDDAQEEAPIVTGYLASSITATIDEFRAEVQPAAEYAAFVEFGTYKMRAQPYLIPAANKNEPRFVAAIEKMIRALL